VQGKPGISYDESSHPRGTRVKGIELRNVLLDPDQVVLLVRRDFVAQDGSQPQKKQQLASKRFNLTKLSVRVLCECVRTDMRVAPIAFAARTLHSTSRTVNCEGSIRSSAWWPRRAEGLSS
jgi:hypothetical protein